MRFFLSLLIIVSLCFSFLFITEAQAKRFGGGRSFGMQRTFNTNYARMQPQQSMHTSRMASSANRWGARLAGLAMGGFLAYLLLGHGLTSGILSWAILAGVVFLLMNLLRHRSQPATQSTYYEHVSPSAPTATFTPNQERFTTNSGVYPIGFDAPTFIRDCKIQFIRLQTAYDQKNLSDLREFTMPEVFAEIQMQIQERGDAPNQTIVEKLEAELLDVSTEFQVDLASVRFSGLIQEDSSPSHPFNEIWHFRLDKFSKRWMVAGIQQE